MKVNIANYLIEDLSNRFPMANGAAIDNDIIDVMVDGWFNNHYHTLYFNLASDQKNSTHKRVLM